MKWLSKKTLIPVLLAAIFLGSVLAVFSSGGIQKNQATVIVDIGQDPPYRGNVPVYEETTALSALSGFAYSVEMKQGEIDCIADYCNTNVSKWHFYKLENSAIGPVETEINQSIENYNIQKEEVLVFRYETI